MLIEKFNIKNFRKFEDFTVESNKDNLIVLAGANNTGKTSLVLLLQSIFNNTKMLTDLDISIDVRNKYINELLEYIKSKTPTDPNKFVDVLLKYMSKKDQNLVEELISEKVTNFPISVQMNVSYEENESIGIFADYLMDLDEKNREFYFEYSVKVNKSAFRIGLNEIKDSIFERYNAVLTAGENNMEEIYLFERMFFNEINNYLENKYYYCDQNYDLKNEIDGSIFKQLINFKYISASRKLDDEEKKDKSITNSVIDMNNPLTDESDWKNEFNKLYDSIKTAFKDSNIERELENNTSKELGVIKNSLDDVSDIEIDSMEARLSLEEKTILNLIKSDISINYTYETSNGKMVLGEESQGLGVSNLIYITLEIQKFMRKAKIQKNKINLFIIEEPENHMHVQMQKIFISYLMEIFSQETVVQSLITTHSTEIVKECNFDYIKVIRPRTAYKNFLVDLKQFISKNNEDKTFYETIFKLNFSNIIFADYAILFEGDTERMYLESLLTRAGKYPKLAKKYIAYCQVGGAYAKKYFPLIEALEVKTSVFTDIDYQKRDGRDLVNNKIKALESESTNYTLQHVIKSIDIAEEIKKVSNILERVVDYENYNKNEWYRVFTQNIDDGFGRTLEDALLYQYIKTNNKIFKIEIEDVFTEITKTKWRNIKEHSKFEYSIPNLTNATIRYVADKIKKTDFMYSVILNDENNECIPNYINEGLTWLQRK